MPGHLLYPAMDRDTDTDLRAWINLHPSNWSAHEVLDWVYYVAENMDENGSDVRGEKFNNLTGENLLTMTRVDFERLDQKYGSLLHESFQEIMKNSQFIRPEGLAKDAWMPKNESTPLPSIKHLLVDNWHGGEGYNNFSTNHTMQELEDILTTMGDNKFSPEDLMVQIGHSMYSIDGADNFPDIEITNLDPTTTTTRLGGDDIDTGYDTESSDSMDTGSGESVLHQSLNASGGLGAGMDQNANVHLPVCVQDPSLVGEPSAPPSSKPAAKPKGRVGRPRKNRPPGEEGAKVPGQRGRKLGQGTKGNHLWEFIRDLLFDSAFNPKIIKWEDEEDKVFRIVQSEQVAKLWGKKKNNPNMTYEKLSRALRFCRSQGHFADVPKSGRFPKKLCFRFGEKAVLNQPL